MRIWSRFACTCGSCACHGAFCMQFVAVALSVLKPLKNHDPVARIPHGGHKACAAYAGHKSLEFALLIQVAISLKHHCALCAVYLPTILATAVLIIMARARCSAFPCPCISSQMPADPVKWHVPRHIEVCTSGCRMFTGCALLLLLLLLLRWLAGLTVDMMSLLVWVKGGSGTADWGPFCDGFGRILLLGGPHGYKSFAARPKQPMHLLQQLQAPRGSANVVQHCHAEHRIYGP